MTNLFRLILPVAILVSIVAHAQSAAPAESLTADPAYERNCAKCHGKTAEGRFMAGPSLLSDKTRSMSPDDLRTIITKGKHHMPKFEGKLTPEEIDALVGEIKPQKK